MIGAIPNYLKEWRNSADTQQSSHIPRHANKWPTMRKRSAIKII